MTDRPRPELTEKGQADRQARLEREASALRENLQKRKAQQRSATAPTTAGLRPKTTDTPSITDQ